VLTSSQDDAVPAGVSADGPWTARWICQPGFVQVLVVMG